MKKPLLLSAVLLFAVSAFADYVHINTEPYWDNNITEGYLAQAQTFDAPYNNSTLLSWEFKLAGRSDPGQITFNIFEWTPTGPTGNALFSQTFDWGTQDQVVDVNGINLALTNGQMYGAVVDLQGYDGLSVYFNGNDRGYPGHYAWFYNPAFGGWSHLDYSNQYFMAEFQYTIPEPGSLILMGSALLCWRAKRLVVPGVVNKQGSGSK